MDDLVQHVSVARSYTKKGPTNILVYSNTKNHGNSNIIQRPFRIVVAIST